eukprot:8206004-Ditylum_brightwellii.AAC.1
MDKIHRAKEVVAKESAIEIHFVQNVFIWLALSLAHISTRALVECFCLTVENLTLCTCRLSFSSVSKCIPSSYAASLRHVNLGCKFWSQPIMLRLFAV